MIDYILSHHRQFCNITQSAAIAANSVVGINDKNLLDQLAVIAMQSAMQEMRDCKFHISSGEGEMDQAPLLRAGTIIGSGNIAFDIAVDPVECTTCASFSQNGAMSIMMIAEHGKIKQIPDVYMMKMSVGSQIPRGIVSLDYEIGHNLLSLAEHLDKNVTDLKICLLDRPRHKEIIEQITSHGAKVFLISDGDFLGALYPVLDSYDIDMYYGIGGAPEGVISASVIQNLGGYFCGRMIFEDDEQRARGHEMGVQDDNKIYEYNDLCEDESAVFMSGITNSAILEGVQSNTHCITTNTMMVSKARVDNIVSTQYTNNIDANNFKS